MAHWQRRRQTSRYLNCNMRVRVQVHDENSYCYWEEEKKIRLPLSKVYFHVCRPLKLPHLVEPFFDFASIHPVAAPASES